MTRKDEAAEVLERFTELRNRHAAASDPEERRKLYVSALRCAGEFDSIVRRSALRERQHERRR